MSKELIDFFPLLEDHECDDLILFMELEKPSPLSKLSSKFVFDSIDSQHFKLNFRFEKEDIRRLCTCLSIPATIFCGNGLKVSDVEGICILLRRLAYPNRYCDLMKMFPRTICELSRIFNTMVQIVKGRNAQVLKTLKQPYLTLDQVREFATAIHEKGSPYKNCFGFLDGTVRSMCRPNVDQKKFYNGHKRVHAIKFQSVMLPNGIIGSLFGPIEGRRHDAYLLQQSKLLDELQESFFDNDGNPFYLYGDPAYPLKPHLMVPFKSHNINREKHICNKRMSQVRQSVEWGFGKLIQQFAFLDFKKNLKYGKQSVADYYVVACILTNAHTCLYGSQTSEYFCLIPPTLEEYLNVQ